MARLSLFVFVAALAVYCASSVPVKGSGRCTVPGQVWNECPNNCNNRCPEAIPKGEDCSGPCKPRCVCKTGYVESREGLCIHAQMCEQDWFAFFQSG